MKYQVHKFPQFKQFFAPGICINWYYTTRRVYVAKGDLQLPRHMDEKKLKDRLRALPDPVLGPPTSGICTDASITQKYGVIVRVTDLLGNKLRSDAKWRRKLGPVSTTSAELYGMLRGVELLVQQPTLGHILYCDNIVAVQAATGVIELSPTSKSYEASAWALKRIKALRNKRKKIRIRYWNKDQFCCECPADFGRK